MSLLWLVMLTACVAGCAGAERGGASLRSALEALQRRQRGHRGPVAPPPDYEALYEFLPQQPYPEPDYPDLEDLSEEPNPKYVIKLLEDDERAPESYEYRIVKKKNVRSEDMNPKRESAFRERSHHSDNDRLRDLFIDTNDIEDKKEILRDRSDNDAEYALLLSELWSKYKNTNRQGSDESAPQGIVKLYKEKHVQKRYPDNWGPIAFKKKRSSGSEPNNPRTGDFGGGRKPHGDGMPIDPNYTSYDLTDDDKDDIREEYAIAFQPLDDDNIPDPSESEHYSYDAIEKRFPVTKRSSGSFDLISNRKKKRFAPTETKYQSSKNFRSSAGTDPKIIQDLSKLFGDPNEEIKMHVKRSSEDHTPETHLKPPQVHVMSNATHDHNHNSTSVNNDNSHEQHGHIHHPGISGKEVEIPHENIDEIEKPIALRKKSIDWSDYFGIDKRKKKSFIRDTSQDRLRKQYLDTFNKEVVYPRSEFLGDWQFGPHSKTKRNFGKLKPSEETALQADTRSVKADTEEKVSDGNSKLDTIDKNLKTMEGLIVDEALRYSNVGDELDSKEEQEMKEKLLSRLATAHSLEKMRKALKEFKQSLQIQQNRASKSSHIAGEAKSKRVAIKKEKVDIMSNEIPSFHKSKELEEDFEDEQGAGHYLNGRTEEQFSEGYMGGSGRQRLPTLPAASATGSCPVLAKIVQRCRGVDLLAGDRGQLFLPLCSLHQICYLCGEAPPTTCDLVFLSEADTACEGDMNCQRAARAALMTLRELHDSLADELDGECEASPCLPATLKLNINWQRALQR